MPLYVKDQEVDRLAEKLSTLRKVSKTEAVRQALTHELERVESEPTLVEKAIATTRELNRNTPGSALRRTKPSSTAFTKT